MIVVLYFLIIAVTVAFLLFALKQQGVFDSKDVRAWKYFIARANEFHYVGMGYGSKNYRWKGPDGKWVEASVMFKSSTPTATLYQNTDCILTRYPEEYSAEMARRLLTLDETKINEEDDGNRSRKRSTRKSE